VVHPSPLPVLAEVIRSGFLECRHAGSAIAMRADGSRVLELGTPDAPVLPRSANKPLQAVGMLRAGLDLDGELLAVVAASHSGSDMHLALVRRVLDGAGLDEDSLANPPDLPLDERARLALLRTGGSADRMHHNCSGKHAGMLATCVAAGWPIAGYLDPGHPLQRASRTAVERLAGERVTATAVDGCGAPLFALSLAGLSRAFGRLATAAADTAEGRVAAAMRAHPEVVGGPGRDVTRLLAGVPGLVTKDGAEGVYAAALADGGSCAVKIEDGAGRGRMPVMVALLRRLGCSAPVLDELATLPVRGGGAVVGEVRAVL
jgi:L-asparaginase II